MSRRRFGALSFGGAACAALPSWAAGSLAPVDGLARARPEQQGVDAQAVIAFLDDVAANELELHDFMLARGGKVVAQGAWWPYRTDRLHMLHSATKSFAVSGAAIAIDEGRFGLDDKVISFFPGELPANVSDNLAAMRVRDLLSMESGHEFEISGSAWRPIKTSWVAEFLKVPVVHRPGTTFVYSSAVSFMISAIVSKTTGQSLRDYMEPRFFTPLGIGGIEWESGPGGITPGGNGLNARIADLLKLGLLYNQGGMWRGKRILSPQWVKAATAPQVASGEYGYQWWIGPGGAYYALGLFGQLSIVFPQHDAVLALFSAADFSARLLPLVWKHFPSAFDGGRAADGAALAGRLAGARVLPPLRGSNSPLVARINGRTFRAEPNSDGIESLRFDFAGGRCRFTLNDARGTHRVEVGLRDWVEARTTMTGNKLHHQYQPESMAVVAGGTWRDPSTFEMTWQFVETVFRDTVRCRFDGDAMTFKRSVNINSASTALPAVRAVMTKD
ncbi:beta-lactamase family protein [Sphingomonas sp. MG17]|uniref:Beta-lactamase family protein n=2 Tax=Sphingomonas tagetis TaxID=2949092 RepID=A0A9X2HR33_9SPHN|nr:beta-lactamase family protein [Sphingomonas tagetis]